MLSQIFRLLVNISFIFEFSKTSACYFSPKTLSRFLPKASKDLESLSDEKSLQQTMAKVSKIVSFTLIIATSLWVLTSISFLSQDVKGHLVRWSIDFVVGAICLALMFDEYCRPMCIVHMLSAFLIAMPYIVWKSNMKKTRIPLYVAGHLIQMCRWKVVHSRFVKAEKYYTWNYVHLRCAKMMLVTIFLIHSSACFSYCLSKVTEDTWIISDNSTNIFQLYWNTFYLSITTFLSVGYGDLTPKRMWDKFFVGIFMFSNIFFYTYIVSNLGSIVVHGTTKMMNFRERSAYLRELLMTNPEPHMYREINRHLKLEYAMQREQFGQNDHINSLPPDVKESLKTQIEAFFMNHALFAGVPRHVLFELISEMYLMYVSSEKNIINSGQKVTALYLLLHGSVDVVPTEQRFNGRMLLGVREFILNEVYENTLKANEICRMVKVDRVKFFEVMARNPGMGMIILNNYRMTNEDFREDIKSKIRMQKLDEYFTISNAIEEEDDALARRLIMRGVDSGRCLQGSTALIDATKKRKEDLVSLLLVCGAHPNVTDVERGFTALDYAVVVNDVNIFKLLRKFGAVSTENRTLLTAEAEALERHDDDFFSAPEDWSN